MASKGKIRVVIGNISAKKYFTARCVQDNKTFRTTISSYGPRSNQSFEQAYEKIISIGKQLAKEYKADYVHKTLAELQQDRPGLGPRSPVKKTVEENPLVAKFGNELLFKAMIKHAVKLHGVDKTMEVLNSGLSIVKELKSKKEREHTLISSANIEIARIIVQTRNQGIDMPSPSKEIDAAIQFVMDEANKPKPSKKVNSGALYRLGNEEWNGCGHAPASFSAYLNGNENRSLDDLIVR